MEILFHTKVFVNILAHIIPVICCCCCCYCCCYFCFFFFRVTPVACGNSWARGLIGAGAEAYTTATATLDPSHIFDLHYNLWQCRIPSPLSKARDRTHILTDLLSGNGNSSSLLFFSVCVCVCACVFQMFLYYLISNIHRTLLICKALFNYIIYIHPLTYDCFLKSDPYLYIYITIYHLLSIYFSTT